jgi:hypothetical protein
MLTVNGATRVRCRAVTGRSADQRMLKVTEVRLLPPRNHLLSLGIGIGKIGAA